MQFPKITKSYFLLKSTCSILISLRIFPYSNGCQVIANSHCEFGSKVNLYKLKCIPSLGGGKTNCKKNKYKVIHLSVLMEVHIVNKYINVLNQNIVLTT